MPVPLLFAIRYSPFAATPETPMTHPSVHAQSQPDKIAYMMAETGQGITYRQLDDRSNQGAQLFRALGVQRGDHVAMLLENCTTFMEICWAAQRSGVYYTAISRYLTADEIAYIVKDCGAKVFVTSPQCYDRVANLLDNELKGVKLFMTGGVKPGFESWEAAREKQPASRIADESLGHEMLYSPAPRAGRRASSAPRRKIRSTRSIRLMRMLCVAGCGMSEKTVYLSPAPLYHAAPLRFNMMVGSLGGTSVIMEHFDAENYLRMVENYKITQSQLVPTMFVRMLKLPDDVRKAYDLSTLKGAIHAAAPCPIDVKAKMIDWWGPILVEYYAGSEGNGVTVSLSKDWLKHRGTVGRAVVGSLKILDEEGGELPAGEIGTIYFADGPVFAYHNDPEKTQRAFNDKGWSTLGDVGYVDEDGFLYLTDRKAYMIISGGVNIYPQETEDVLIGHPGRD